MTKRAWAFVLLLAIPSPAYAWGMAVHRYITRRAIDLLPPELKPLFDAHREELVMRSVDPDLWRTVGWDELPNHFVDFGADEYGSYPFTALPRDYTLAVERFGVDVVRKNGTLPWREAEMYGDLRRAFEGFARNVRAVDVDTVLFAATGSHYIQDAHQPFHATNNFDGQLTGQRGIHSRFETELFDRFEARMTITPAQPAAMKNPRDTAFDILLASYKDVQPLLDADKAAAQGKELYDDDYFEKFFTRVKPLVEQRIAASITATASFIIGAWEAAGRPQIKTVMPRRIERAHPQK
jgi:hypothetical protein